MEQIKINVYELNELKPEVQEKVLNEYRYFNVEGVEWYNFIEEEILNDLEKHGLNVSGKQQTAKDYFNFDLDTGTFNFHSLIVSDYTKLIKKALSKKEYLQYTLLMKLADKERDFNIMIEINRFKKVVVNISSIENAYSDELGKDTEFYDFTSSILEPKIKQLIEVLQKKYLLMLKEEYDYLTSDEAIKESLDCNEYRFLYNGQKAPFIYSHEIDKP